MQGRAKERAAGACDGASQPSEGAAGHPPQACHHPRGVLVQAGIGNSKLLVCLPSMGFGLAFSLEDTHMLDRAMHRFEPSAPAFLWSQSRAHMVFFLRSEGGGDENQRRRRRSCQPAAASARRGDPACSRDARGGGQVPRPSF